MATHHLYHLLFTHEEWCKKPLAISQRIAGCNRMSECQGKEVINWNSIEHCRLDMHRHGPPTSVQTIMNMIDLSVYISKVLRGKILVWIKNFAVF